MPNGRSPIRSSGTHDPDSQPVLPALGCDPVIRLVFGKDVPIVLMRQEHRGALSQRGHDGQRAPGSPPATPKEGLIGGGRAKYPVYRQEIRIRA